MKTLILNLILILVVTSTAIAGKSYPGYLILNDGVRIEGSIEMLSPTLNEVKVKIVTTEGQKASYKAKSVKEYGFKLEKINEETKKYESKFIIYERKEVVRNTIAFGSKVVLIQRELKGNISLYNHYYQRNSNVDGRIGHSFYVEDQSGELTWLTKNNYKDTLKLMTESYPELNVLIGTKNFGYKHIRKIINTYNDWMIDNGEEVVFHVN